MRTGAAHFGARKEAFENVLSHLVYHKRYNYLTKQLLSRDSLPLLSLDSSLMENDGLFFQAIMADNFEIAFAYFNSVPIEEVLVGLPLRDELLKKILQSEYAYEFLVKVGENKDKLMCNFSRGEPKFTNYSDLFDIYASPKERGEEDEEEEDYHNHIDPNDKETIVYAYYQYENVLK